MQVKSNKRDRLLKHQIFLYTYTTEAYMKKYLIIIVLFFSCYCVKARQLKDSAQLKEVVVRSYFSNRPLLTLPASVSIVDSSIFKNHPPYSLLPALNSIPGIRMEERSPGSYRLSIRGSLLRSPFGIRNVKIYMDDFMLTDAGGNTYLNILDAGSTNEIEVLKGPEGSIYGANSGGVLAIHPGDIQSDSSYASASVTGGSYGLLHQNLSLKHKWKDFQLNVNEAYQRSDGYRENSSLERKYVHILPRWNYSESGKLNAIILFSDLQYETPGGLTLEQLNANRRAARPQSLAQQAEIFNETILAGLSHEIQLSSNLKHVVSLTASHTDFKNPTINNYEFRNENSAGLRTYLETTGGKRNWYLQTGFEGQQTSLEVDRYDNESGEMGLMQTSDKFKASQGFGFAHLSVNPIPKLNLESAVSVNFFSYNYESFYPSVAPLNKRQFKNQVMPRFAASYLLKPSIAVRASLSRGYSPPTLEEVNPSNMEINTGIEAEKGWNHEIGLRLNAFNNRVYWDAVYFYYHLKDAIVRGVATDDRDYYINAGGTDQHGFESELIAWLIRASEKRFIKTLLFRNSLTLSSFKFSKYTSGGADFSGNNLTGVPKSSVVTSLEALTLDRLNLFVQHSFTSRLPLNDANAVYADEYHLVSARASWKLKVTADKAVLFAGVDNVLNERYSLGNDLNAFGGRYFNPASTRSFFAGINVKF
ncbi:TonB-dependent receptor [Desertivirga xinjiangensis]|uniref:TonB-dependent receptor n=1 Tax=Desertivirga xinjiangensis TaxID=539206 RepID=UPI002108D9B7|nr:TonB-dependent receptor [Pedobacter xinjiangensis]